MVPSRAYLEPNMTFFVTLNGGGGGGGGGSTV